MSEASDRHRFLGTLRERIGAGLPQNRIRPLEPSMEDPPTVTYVTGGTDAVTQFSAAAALASATVRHVASPASTLESLLEEVVRDHGVRRAVVSADPECDGVVDLLRALAVDAEPLSSPAQAAAADLGVTGAVCGVALTGSLVVDSARAGGRTASLLPRVHLALLPIDRIVPTPGDVLRLLSPGLGAAPPSNLVLITGPSRSADIELQLTLGVHGPQTVIIALLDSAPAGVSTGD